MASKSPKNKKSVSQNKLKAPNPFMQKLKANPLALVFVLFFAVAGSVFLFQSYAATSPNTIKIYLQPGSGTFRRGTNVTVDVRENSLTTAVNAVNAEITYDTTKFSVVSIDSSGSPFEFKFVEDSSGGVIRLARGSTTAKTGDNLVARVTLAPLAKVRKTSLIFNSNTALASADTSTNVLQTKVNGTYNIR